MRKDIREYPKTKLVNRGRAAGIGITEDDYSEESFPGPRYQGAYNPYVFDNKQKEHPPGPVTIYKMVDGKLTYVTQEEGV